jgi:hypothetical protein
VKLNHFQNESQPDEEVNVLQLADLKQKQICRYVEIAVSFVL